MWDLHWKDNHGETRGCSIDEEYARDVIISICASGVFLDDIEVLTPTGPVKAHSVLKD